MPKQKMNTIGRDALQTPRDKQKGDLFPEKDSSAIPVLVLFVLSFVIHLILNFLVKEDVKIFIDESLYTNIARSLAWEGKLAYRSQPVDYPYLLYPVLLVPVFWLNRLTGGDIYRFVQAFNTLLITSSVFPAYGFAHDFTKDKKKALMAAVIVACMPDMIMGSYEMAEALIWPLSLWMIFFCYRFFTANRLRDGLLTALFSGLLFAAKPGAIAAGAAMLLLHAVKLLRTDKSKIKNTLLSVLLLLAMVGAVYGIYAVVFGGSGSMLGLYTKQTSEWKPQDIWVAVEATLLMLFLFIFACGGIYGVFPLTHLPAYQSEKRHFILSFLLGVFVVIIGTAVFVVPYQWTSELGALPLHLRYCSMFIPMMYVFSADMDPDPKYIRRFIIALAVFIVLALFPGARAGFIEGNSTCIDSVTLSAFVISNQLNGKLTGWILTVIVVAFSSFMLLFAFELQKQQKKEKKKKSGSRVFHRFIAAYFILFIVFNSVCAHFSGRFYADAASLEDALEVNQMITGKQCLGITQRYYNDNYTYYLESRLNEPMQQVTTDQIFFEMDQSKGVYSPFVPMDQSPNINNHETPDTDTFVLGMTIAEHLELSDSVVAQKTKNGRYTIVQIQPGQRWVDTMMYGLDDNALYADEIGYIDIFDNSRNIDGNLIITITAKGNGVLNIGGTKLTMEGTEKTYEVTVPFSSFITVKAENGTVEILSYTTQKQ